MEQHILSNTESIISKFNELLITTIDNEKDKIIEEFKAQIKTDVIQKLNGNTEILFPNQNITLNDIKNEINLPYIHHHFNIESLKKNFIDKIEYNINFNNDEYIIYKNHKLLNFDTNGTGVVCGIIILTNYGSFVMKNNMYADKNIIYKGKYIMQNEYLYILCEIIKLIFPQSIRIVSNSPDMILYKLMMSIVNIIEKIQTDYFAKPLIGYHAQQLIDENIKLKEENEYARKIYNEIQKEKDNILQLQNKLDVDMKKYSNIKDMEKKWNELKEYKIKLELFAEENKLEKEELEKEKQKLEEEKQKFNKSKVEVDIKKSKLNDDFLKFANDESDEDVFSECVDDQPINKKNIDFDSDENIFSDSENKQPTHKFTGNKNINNEMTVLYEKIKKDPLILKEISDDKKTESLCILAVEENIFALEYVPKNMLSDIYRYLLKEHDNMVDNMPEHLITQEFCNIAVDVDVNNFKKIPENFRTEELCSVVMAQYEDFELDDDVFLMYVPNKYKTKETCEKIVKINTMEFRGVPDELKTTELCILAVQEDVELLHDIPDDKKYNVIDYLVKNDPYDVLSEISPNDVIEIITQYIKNLISSNKLFPDIDINKSTRAVKSLIWTNIVTKFPTYPIEDIAIELFKQSTIDKIKQFTNDDILKMINILDEHDKNKQKIDK